MMTYIQLFQRWKMVKGKTIALLLLLGTLTFWGCATVTSLETRPSLKPGLTSPIISEFKFEPMKVKWGEEASYNLSYHGANGGVKEIVLEVELYFKAGRFEMGEVQRRASWKRVPSSETPNPQEIAPFVDKTAGRFEKRIKTLSAPREGWSDPMTFTFYLWIVDQEGLKSNVLSADLTVSSK